jgi:SHS2 domain-containing protein
MTQPAEQSGRGGCGHTSVPHTADLRIEAWGPTREDCIAEAVRGLVESFADVSGARRHHTIECHLTAGSDADLLAAAVEEVIYVLDTAGEVPVAVAVGRAADGGIDLALLAVDASMVEIIGAAPKAASLSGLACASDASGRWSCAVTIDV